MKDSLARVYQAYQQDALFVRHLEKGWLDQRFVPAQCDENSRPLILFLGEAPGQKEAELGMPFVGPSGHVLDELLEGIGLTRETCWITNVVKWRPIEEVQTEGGGWRRKNRTPDQDEIVAARPYLRREVKLARPLVIVPLGASALACVDSRPAGRLTRGSVTYRNGYVFLPTFHPAATLYPGGKRLRGLMEQHFRMLNGLVSSFVRGEDWS